MNEPNRAPRRRGTLTRVSTTSGAGQPQRIVYQGEPGSNSHLACQRALPRRGGRCLRAASRTCFAAVEGGDADLAMIPIDNSIAGRVADIHHFLPDVAAAHRRRALPADPVRAARRPGRDARRRQDRAQPRARARPVPQGDPRARLRAGHLRRHRRRGARGEGGRRPDPGRDLAAAGRRDLRPRGAARRRRGRGPQHHAVRGPLPRLRCRRRPATARS